MDVNSLSEINGGDRLSAIPKPGPIPQPEVIILEGFLLCLYS